MGQAVATGKGPEQDRPTFVVDVTLAVSAAAVCEAGMLARDLDHNRRAMDQLDYEPASSAA